MKNLRKRGQIWPINREFQQNAEEKLQARMEKLGMLMLKSQKRRGSKETSFCFKTGPTKTEKGGYLISDRGWGCARGAMPTGKEQEGEKGYEFRGLY